MKARMTLLAVCLAASCTQAAHAQGGPTEETQASPEAPHARVWDRREMMTQLEIGYRGSFVTNAGYNPFSTNDYLPQFSLAASQTVFAWHRFAFAAGIAWDFANTGATARGDTSSLTMHRLTAPLEGRTHFGDWGYLFLRVAPGTAVVNAEIDDPSAPAPLAKNRWLFATDVSAGYAWLIAPRGRAWRRVPRLWVQTDAGYGWMASDRLNLAPASAGASGVDLGSLALSGAFFRIAAAASF
jgi:hypothetical protein